MSSLRERSGDFRRRNHRAERTTVPDSFRHRHDVWNHALRFESPVMRTSPTETGLHFIGDANAAGGADMFVSVLEIIVGKNNATADALN